MSTGGLATSDKLKIVYSCQSQTQVFLCGLRKNKCLLFTNMKAIVFVTSTRYPLGFANGLCKAP